MDEILAAQLLAAIEGGRLVVLCGAGISFPAPSNVPSASRLATLCAHKYQNSTGHILPPDHKTDLEKIAKHFKDRNELQATFISQVVDWTLFDGLPNTGHIAVADFLACKAIHACVTTNYDLLIENAAKQLGERDFRAVVEQNDINRNGSHAPLLKIHGCSTRSRWDTVWCVEQLTEPPLQARIAAFTVWLTAQLQQRDLLLVGFWSDWAYLNAVISQAVVGAEPRSITLVDPGDANWLEQKAPALWLWANSGRATFKHVQVGGESFLEELRRRFSRQFLNRCIEDARPEFDRQFGPSDAALGLVPDTLGTSDYYQMRRAFCGQMANEPVRRSRPQPDQSMTAIVHLLFFKQGAVLEGALYRHNGHLFRLLWTPGRFLSAAKMLFGNEPPIFSSVTRTVCVDATDDGGAPPNIVRPGVTGHIIRSGASGEWITSANLIAQFGATP